MFRLTRIFLFVVLIIVANLGLSTATQAQENARLSCRIDPSSLALNGQATLIVEIANIQNLFGYELAMTYNSSLIQIQDADSEKAGTNIQPVNTFLSPDFVVLNSADSGQVRLALTQLAPSGPKSGSGELARATIVGIGAGFANFAFGDVIFSDANGQVIGVSKQDCLVEIGSAGQPTPTNTPLPTETSTPTQTSTTPAQPPTATFTPPVATATFTPWSPSPTPTESSPAPAATQTTAPPTETPTTTATVFIVTTPTPSLPTSEADHQRAEEAQPQSPLATSTPMPTEVAPTVTWTPSVISQAASSSAETSDPGEASTSSQSPMPGQGQEVLSPPGLSDTETSSSQGQDVVAAGEVSAPTATASPEPTATATAIRIARVVQEAPLAVEVLQQPESPVSLTKRVIGQGWGWLLLVLTPLLVIVAWRLRKV